MALRPTRTPQRSIQRQRHQLLSTGTHTGSPASTAPAGVVSETALADDPPKDTLSAIYYLLNLLQPSRVKQLKVFPRVCMIHQIYSITKDHTTVDRTLAQLIQQGTIRKFYLGGTGSDEFAVMLTSDYVLQIQQAKERYLEDLQEQQQQQASVTALAFKRKLEEDPRNLDVGSGRPKKRTVLTSKSLPQSSATVAAAGGTVAAQGSGGEIFDRFQELVTSGLCMEISIQHSNIQAAIGATDQDITTLIRYSLLNRSLSAPANPHLVNLNQPAPGRGTAGSPSGGHSATMTGHSALNQLIAATNQEHAKGVKAETSSASSAATVPTGNSPVATATTITAASGRRERVSDDVAYRFAIRQGGLFVTHFLKGRLEILRMIKRQMFGDMLTSAVVAKPLRGSFLPHEFHIHDLVGSGRVQSMTTSSGQLLKLTQKGVASAKAG
ncbi:Serine/threonine-protein kinase 19 [Mortierella alpina]|nr:Serine/threonine-protein kinase 19 [Mortierella alpina]